MEIRVGEIFFDPNIQLDLTYVCIFIVKKCWQLSYKQILSQPMKSSWFLGQPMNEAPNIMNKVCE